MVAAAIYGPDGNLFARYTRKGVASLPPPKQPGEGQDSGWSAANMAVVQPALDQNQTVLGTVFIRSDMQEATARLRQYVGLTLLILAGSLLIAYLLSSQLQRGVSEPILDLAQTARVISVEENYSARAVKRTRDEIGFLIDQFNQMLGQIEKRDAALRDLNEDLVDLSKRRWRRMRQRASSWRT